MSSALQLNQCPLAVSTSLNRADVRVFADSHSHRGFSPVIKDPSGFRVTVLTVFRYALKGGSYPYRIRSMSQRKQKTVKTVLRVHVVI